MSPIEGTIEVVRGRLDGDLAERILRFWVAHGALTEEAGRRRLDEVVAVVLDGSGEVAAVASVYAEDVPLVERRFWMLRSVVAEGFGEDWPDLVARTFEALDREHAEDRSGPVGLCAVIPGEDELARRPEVIWPRSELMLAGYMEDGRQIRIRYFDDAVIGPGFPNSPTIAETREMEYPMPPGYRIEPIAESDATPDDVLALWRREGAVPEDEARRRVHEVQLVAIEDSAGVVGVSTTYLHRNAQLRADLWYYRTFVGADHRKAHLAAQMIFANRDLLEARFVSGEDTRGIGLLFELENEGLRRYFNRGLWLPADFTFIGENERGAHLRVHYFPGARIGNEPR